MLARAPLGSTECAAKSGWINETFVYLL